MENDAPQEAAGEPTSEREQEPASSTPTGIPTGPGNPQANLVIVRGALLAGLCRFVPVPYLDDFLHRQARRHLVGSLLVLHGHQVPPRALRPLYYEPRGCGALLWAVIMFPLSLLWKTVTKTLKTLLFFLMVREAALDLLDGILLGRALDRALIDGRIPTPNPARGARDEAFQNARVLKAAHESAVAGSDWRAVTGVLAGVLRGVRGIGSLGASVARRLFGLRTPKVEQPDVAQDVQQLSGDEQAEVEGLSQKLLGALRQPELVAYFEEYDRRLDEGFQDPAVRRANPNRLSLLGALGLLLLLCLACFVWWLLPPWQPLEAPGQPSPRQSASPAESPSPR